jgi:hypothetical protein
MGGSSPGPTNHNPFSSFGAPRTPGPLGRNDAADPDTLTLRGDTPGSLGLNDDFDVSRMVETDWDYVLRHRELKSHLIESVRLSDPTLQLNHALWTGQSVWRVPSGQGGAIVFRVSNLAEDLDGSPRAYHPPTEDSWDGGPPNGPGKDSLPNAVGQPPLPISGTPKKHVDWPNWPLTAGCQLFRDLQKARGLEKKAAAAAQPAGGNPPAANPANADKTAKEAQDAKDALDTIYKKYGVKKLSELEDKSKTAVCVQYVDGRTKKASQDDWSHVKRWVGIQTDKSGKPIIRDSGPNKGFYIPAITPGWADAEKHPWVVLNPPEDEFGVCKTNSAVVIKNGDSPSIAYGMVADVGPRGHLGEVSRKMMDDLGFTGKATPAGDYIVVLFPKNLSNAEIAKEKKLSQIQEDAKTSFEAWTWEGRTGIDLINELFPMPALYHLLKKNFLRNSKYSKFNDHLTLK